jgi:hypothetical protein
LSFDDILVECGNEAGEMGLRYLRRQNTV